MKWLIHSSQKEVSDRLALCQSTQIVWYPIVFVEKDLNFLYHMKYSLLDITYSLHLTL